MNQALLVFTDLDGTLLDHEDYSYAAANEALAELRSRRIPLILCSSKTAAVSPRRGAISVTRSVPSANPVKKTMAK